MCLSFSCSSRKQFLFTVQGETSKASSFKQMARRWQSRKHPEKLTTRDPLITTEKTWVPGHHGNAVRDHSNSSAPWRNSSPPLCTQTSPFSHPTPVHTPKRRQRIHHRHPTSVNTLISTSALLGCQEHNDTPQLNSSW